MKVTKSLVIAAVLCVAKVNAIDFSSVAAGANVYSGKQDTIHTTDNTDPIQDDLSDAEPCNEEFSTAGSDKEDVKGVTSSDVEKSAKLTETNNEDCNNEYDMANPDDCDTDLDIAKEEEDCDEDLTIVKEEDDCVDDLTIAKEEDDCVDDLELANTDDGNTPGSGETTSKGDANTYNGETAMDTVGGEGNSSTSTKVDAAMKDDYTVTKTNGGEEISTKGDANTNNGETVTETVGGGETAGGEPSNHTYEIVESENTGGGETGTDSTNDDAVMDDAVMDDAVMDDSECPEGYDIADSECSDEYEIATDDCTDELDIAGAELCGDELEMADKVDTTEAADCSEEFSIAGSEVPDTDPAYALADMASYAPTPGGVKPASTGNDAQSTAKQTAFSVKAVKFQSSGAPSTTTSMAVPLAAAAAACAALAIVGVIYMKRRNKKSKEAESDIFTVDKNSAL